MMSAGADPFGGIGGVPNFAPAPARVQAYAPAAPAAASAPNPFDD